MNPMAMDEYKRKCERAMEELKKLPKSEVSKREVNDKINSILLSEFKTGLDASILSPLRKLVVYDRTTDSYSRSEIIKAVKDVPLRFPQADESEPLHRIPTTRHPKRVRRVFGKRKKGKLNLKATAKKRAVASTKERYNRRVEQQELVRVSGPKLPQDFISKLKEIVSLFPQYQLKQMTLGVDEKGQGWRDFEFNIKDSGPLGSPGGSIC